MLLDILYSRTIVKGSILSQKPIHIGTGDEGINPVQVDSPVLKDSEGNPVIPGSSLKGVLRSRIESILSNPAFEDEWSSCNIFASDGNCKKKIEDIKKSNKEKGVNPDLKDFANTIYTESCDVCRLFGNGHISARIQIKDMYFKSGVDSFSNRLKTERRDGVGIDRDSGTAFRGAKYGFEIVPAGTEFDFYIIAENLDEKQDKLFNLILRLLENGEISVGGKTSRGLGQIVLKEGYTLEKIDKKNIAEYYGLGVKK